MGFDNVVALSGLFYIGSKKNENCGSLETVLSWNHFWGNSLQLQQPSFTPFSHNSNVFDYLEMFEVSDPAFYSHCQNNNMDLKLWEKKGNSLNELLNIPILLHPFYDAFSNPTLINQFYKEKMPIVSFVDWIDVNVGCSTSDAVLSAKIQILLAIGTPDQLDNLKHSHHITIPASISSKVDKPNPVAKKSNQTALADMLSNFIDNLALSLPKRSESEQHQQCPSEPRFQLKRTSDLLDVLQNALKNPTPANLITSQLSTMPLKINGKVPNATAFNHQNPIYTNVRALITIDSARNMVQTNKQTTTGSLSNDANFKDDKPCTYVSFEAANCDKPDQCSNYVTNIVQYNCNPDWNKLFDVILPAKLFQQNNKDFVLKVWRKMSAKQISQDSNHMEEDEIVGCSIIDLSNLLSGKKIAGYHNIIDNKGHVNGQLKINIVPMDDIKCQENSKFLTEDATLPNSFKDLENCSYDVDNIIFSRTLKRKFTELEEISQRLKSRLLDVTADDNFDMDDEFENDLNTCPDENEIDSRHQFDWNRFSALEIDCTTSEQLNVDQHFHNDNEVRVDRTDFSTSALQHSVLNVSGTDCKNSSSTDEDTTTKSQSRD